MNAVIGNACTLLLGSATIVVVVEGSLKIDAVDDVFLVDEFIDARYLQRFLSSVHHSSLQSRYLLSTSTLQLFILLFLTTIKRLHCESEICS
jgi:hypothetical protein